MRRYHDGAVLGMFAACRAKTLHKRHTPPHPQESGSFCTSDWSWPKTLDRLKHQENAPIRESLPSVNKAREIPVLFLQRLPLLTRIRLMQLQHCFHAELCISSTSLSKNLLMLSLMSGLQPLLAQQTC